MQKDKIKEAMYEARQFLGKAEAHIKNLEAEDSRGYRSQKTGGALRRASMDLTRALAEMRKAEM